MERIFWVAGPCCRRRFYCDYDLRFREIQLSCPFCGHHFLVRESPEIDERR